MCQAQGGQGAVASPPAHLMQDLSLGPQSFHLSGAHPEGVGAPRAPPDPGHKLSSAQLVMGNKDKPQILSVHLALLEHELSISDDRG